MSSRSPKPGGVPIVAPHVFVKGGTSSSTYDKELAQRRAQAEARRAGVDKMAADVRNADASQGVMSAMMSRTAAADGSSQVPKMVLNFLGAERKVVQQAVVDLVTVPRSDGGVEMAFIMVCPDCVARGVPEGDAQMLIRDSHRKFFVDVTKAGIVPVEKYEYAGKDASGDDTFVRVLEQQPVVGKVTVNDRIKCANYNCTFACRIDASNVYRD